MDSDLVNPIILYDDALASRLKDQVAELRTIACYAGELDEEAMQQIAAERLPAVYTIYAGATLERPNDDERDRLAQWMILLAVAALRGRDEATRSDSRGAGAYSLLRAITEAVDGARLPDNAAPASIVTEERFVGEMGKVMLYQISIATRLTETITEAEEEE
jgi:hypothetical protein